MADFLICLLADALFQPSIVAGSSQHDAPAVVRVASLAEAAHALRGEPAVDALVAVAGLAEPIDEFAALASRAALIVVGDAMGEADALEWLRRGADDVIERDDFVAATRCWRRIRFAVERRRVRDARQHPYSTDLATGLPHRQQLLEHLSQLLALREREPAPMAVLALRTETAGGASLGDDGAATLRRKAAVRLRAGVRSSDVVAAADDDAFVVLLGAVLTPADAVQVASKVVASLLEPFVVGGATVSLAVAVGIAHYPEDGSQADKLLRRALALAAVAPPVLQDGRMTVGDAYGGKRSAANDDN